MALSFDIEDGMKVLSFGRISVYDKRGQYQLYVNKVEPKGKGALQLAFEQLKERLKKEGLFEEENKKPLPAMPVRVGVVTSPTGAAIRDILKVAKRRYSNIEITIYPVQVQGDKAKTEISEAIKALNEYNSHLKTVETNEHPIDVIIVGRGGGSLEDLWAFNEEIVARAIYASEIPIISAVGHEIDYTISDFVADHRAPTPSAAAELVVPSKKDIAARIKDLESNLKAGIKDKINLLEKDLGALKNSYVLRTPLNIIIQLGQQVDDLTKTIVTKMEHLFQIKSKELGSWAGKLDMLSPLAVLERGYSITFKEKSIVKDSKKVKKGDLLKTRIAKGLILSKVESVKE